MKNSKNKKCKNNLKQFMSNFFKNKAKISGSWVCLYNMFQLSVLCINFFEFINAKHLIMKDNLILKFHDIASLTHLFSKLNEVNL